MKTSDIDILFPLPPTLCEKCGQQLIAYAYAVDPGVTQILHHCAHKHTLAHATLSEVDGKRAIIKWVFEAPVTQEHAVTMAEQLGKSQGDEFEVLNIGGVH